MTFTKDKDGKKIVKIYVQETPDGRRISEGIDLDKKYKVIYKNSKTKRKLLQEVHGNYLLSGLSQIRSVMDFVSENYPNNEFELNQQRDCFVGLVETWGRQGLGLRITHPFSTKESKRLVKQKDPQIMKLIFGVFGSHLSKEIKKTGKEFNTIEILDYIPTKKQMEEMNIPKHRQSSCMTYGVNKYSYS
jgi:hypothetical protein